MPKVSVVIPTYNRAKFIASTIESVLAQSFRDFEIIVIDDGSTDNTMEIVSAFPVKYLKQQNQGPGAARNKGIEVSAGEYIAFLDSDDALFKNSLAKSVEVLDSHPDVGVSYGQAYVTDEKENIIDIEPPFKSSCVRQGWEELKNYLLTGYHVTMSTVLVRRRCLEETGGFKAAFRSGSEDLNLWIRLAKRCGFAYISEPLARWGPLSRGFSAKRSLLDWEKANSAIIESICNDGELSSRLRHVRPVAYFLLYSNMARRACRRGEMKTARRYLFRAVKVHSGSVFGKLGLFWIICFVRTWVPLPLIALISGVKHHLMRALSNKFKLNL